MAGQHPRLCPGRLPAQQIRHIQPPCTAVTTSTWSPSRSGVAAQEPRGTTSPLRAAATPAGAAVSSATACAIVLPFGQFARLAVELHLQAHAAPSLASEALRRERLPLRRERLAGEAGHDGVRGHRRHQDAVAVVAGGQQQAGCHSRPIPGAEPADDRAVVRRARPQSGARLGQDQLARHREHAHGVAQQVVHGARGHRPVRAAFFLGRAHDYLAVGARHQVDIGAAHRGPDRVADDGRHPVRVPQPQQLALDRPDRRPHLRRQPGDRAGGAAGGHDDLSRADLAAVREPDAAGPPVPRSAPRSRGPAPSAPWRPPPPHAARPRTAGCRPTSRPGTARRRARPG